MFRRIKDFILGSRSFIVSQRQYDTYKTIKRDLNSSFDRVETIKVTGKQYEIFRRELPVFHQWCDPKDDRPNLLVSKSFYRFIMEGGSWDELSTFEAVKGYGFLFGEKRRLVVV